MALIEISFNANEFIELGFTGRDQIEDPLDGALRKHRFGEVTGGGTGLGVTNIDVETDDSVATLVVVDLMKDVLRKLNAPRTTVITECEADERSWNVYDEK